MHELAGSGQVIIFDSFEDLSRRLAEEFKKSKSCGKLRLLRNEQLCHYTLLIFQRKIWLAEGWNFEPE